jgi:uncharacterized protein YndB with AHSA1/START domain
MITKHKTYIVADSNKQEMFIKREFDAPAEVVFKTFTDPNLYAQWIGPREFTTHIEEFDARNGGSWRFTQRDPQGDKFSFHGVFHDVTAPDISIGQAGRIIQTFEFEGLPESGHVILDTTKIESIPGDRTKVTSQSVFMSVEDRDGMFQSDMERGLNEGYDRLDELLEKLHK